MKRNLTKRVFAAAALAVIAAAVSACGSSNNNGVASASCIPGQICTSAALGGVGINTSSGGCTVSFTGTAVVDQAGGLSGQMGVSGQTVGMASSAGGYTYGRIGTDGSILELNFSGTGTGAYVAVQGILSISQLQTSMMANYGLGCGSFSELTLNEVFNEPMANVQNIIGAQPFAYALYSGQVALNGSYPVSPY